eukprot:COSAG05_NODE_551_length_8736_cov_5.409401_5_plen_123_part_00
MLWLTHHVVVVAVEVRKWYRIEHMRVQLLTVVRDWLRDLTRHWIKAHPLCVAPRVGAHTVTHYGFVSVRAIRWAKRRQPRCWLWEPAIGAWELRERCRFPSRRGLIVPERLERDPLHAVHLL